ncbi:MAG: hypothetical protein NWF05_07280 [Candidatus Bathyarchaeota archaeon]|nr:hypothetical protein [Candidatus Bathyarchaeota archaeon]
MPKAVCLVGGDGTGKTAHAKKIVSDLRKAGFKCRYVWFGQPYLFSYPFMFLCSRLGYTKKHILQNRVVCKEHQYHKNKALATVWPWVQLFDLAVLVLTRVYLPVWRGIIVVCDRFVYDTLVELMTDTGNSNLPWRTAGKLMRSLNPSFSVVIRLNVDAQTAFERKNDVPDVRFLRLRRENYQIIGRQLNIKTVDAEQPFDVVHCQIMECLKGSV